MMGPDDDGFAWQQTRSAGCCFGLSSANSAGRLIDRMVMMYTTLAVMLASAICSHAPLVSKLLLCHSSRVAHIFVPYGSCNALVCVEMART